MSHESRPTDIPDFFPGDLPQYQIGQMVRHRRYGYRGVIVDFDMACQADEDWYQHNRTQPDRDQPWYHVLVDGSDGTTYAAQASLMRDDTDEPISHPLLGHFFDAIADGRYLRNDEPWPGW